AGQANHVSRCDMCGQSAEGKSRQESHPLRPQTLQRVLMQFTGVVLFKSRPGDIEPWCVWTNKLTQSTHNFPHPLVRSKGPNRANPKAPLHFMFSTKRLRVDPPRIQKICIAN